MNNSLAENVQDVNVKAIEMGEDIANDILAKSGVTVQLSKDIRV